MGLTVAELEQEIVSQGAAQTGLLTEIVDARGTARTLGARLDVALYPDGTPRTSVATVSFVTEIAPIISYPPTGAYVALKGDLTAVYVAKRRLRINGALLPYVTSSTYDAGGDYTVVNFSTPVGNSITSVEYSFDPAVMPPLHYSGNPDIEQVVSGISTFATKHLSDAQYKSLLDDILARVTITSLASVDDGAGVDLVGRAFKYVDTIDDLRTLTPTDVPVYVQGRTIPGDGGHGTFYWDATSTDADDGQDTIAVTGVSIGRWKRNIDPITGELSTHINRTTVHESTDAPMPGRIVQRDFYGCSSFAPATEQSHAVVLGQLAAIIMNQIVSSFEGDLSGTNSGWLKLPGGMIIQWGKNITASTENTWIVHDFPIPFPTTAFVIVGTGTDASVNLDPAIRINIYGLGQFRIWNTGYTSKYVNWIALGSEETEAPPSIVSASINAAGNQLSVVFSEAMSKGAGYQNTDINLDGSLGGTDIGLTYVSGSGTDTWVFSIATVIRLGETVDLDYNGRPDGIEDANGNDLGAVASMAVTNGSEEDYSDIVCWSGFDGALVDPVYTATDLDYPPRHTWYVRVANNSRLAQEYAMVGATALYLRLYSYRVYAEIPPMSTQRGRVGCWVRPISALHGIVALTGGAESYAWSISLRTAPGEYGKITLDGRLNNNGFGGVWTLPEPIINLTPYYIELGWDFPLGYFDLWINGNYMGRVEYTSEVAGTFGYVSVGVNPMITNYVDAAYDNVIVSTDPNRDLYALAMLEACPRV